MKNPIVKFLAFIASSLLIVLIVYFISKCGEEAPAERAPPGALDLSAGEPYKNGDRDFAEIPVNDDAPLFFPIIADPAEAINYNKESWRDSRYGLFSWDILAQSGSPVLIFDFADYDMQNKMLKRMAFFVEKAGFRGRLSRDEEIAHLHGWNAHDYRAEDLARFFDAARKENFPLLDEEWELEQILLDQKIIKMETSGIFPGKGAIISISRESTEYLRYSFMAHEGFHALYFVDEDFRYFCRRRWEQFPSPARNFLTAYFDNQQYDTSDEYLLVNEFMGHIMQQNIESAFDYFGRHLPSILERSARASALPEKDQETGTWPYLAEVFTEEARAMSDYASSRWGFTAGRAWRRR